MTGYDERMEKLADVDDIVWPEPREDPPQERSHRAARKADRKRGVERGDVEDES